MFLPVYVVFKIYSWYILIYVYILNNYRIREFFFYSKCSSYRSSLYNFYFLCIIHLPELFSIIHINVPIIKVHWLVFKSYKLIGYFTWFKNFSLDLFLIKRC